MPCPRPTRCANLRYHLRQRDDAMSVQRSSDASDHGVRTVDGHRAAGRRSPGKRTVESLTGGLRSVYPLDDQATTSEVFSDVIDRLRQGRDEPH